MDSNYLKPSDLPFTELQDEREMGVNIDNIVNAAFQLNLIDTCIQIPFSTVDILIALYIGSTVDLSYPKFKQIVLSSLNLDSVPKSKILYRNSFKEKFMMGCIQAFKRRFKVGVRIFKRFDQLKPQIDLFFKNDSSLINLVVDNEEITVLFRRDIASKPSFRPEGRFPRYSEKEPKRYEAVYDYLKTKQPPSFLENDDMREKWDKTVVYSYKLEPSNKHSNSDLCKITPNGDLLTIPFASEKERVVSAASELAASKSSADKISSTLMNTMKIYWSRMEEDIDEFINRAIWK